MKKRVGQDLLALTKRSEHKKEHQPEPFHRPSCWFMAPFGRGLGIISDFILNAETAAPQLHLYMYERMVRLV